jgi:hypothetical protein
MRLLGSIPSVKLCQNYREFSLLVPSVRLVSRSDVSVCQVMPDEVGNLVEKVCWFSAQPVLELFSCRVPSL